MTESILQIVRPTPSSPNVYRVSVLPVSTLTQSNSPSLLTFETILGDKQYHSFIKMVRVNLLLINTQKQRVEVCGTYYNWLEYSIAANKAFCFPYCLSVSTGYYDEIFISNGLKTGKN